MTALLQEDDVIPNAGDMLLAKVTKTGHPDGLELTHGRCSALFTGDEIIVCYGNHYVPDQFETQVPKDLGSCDLVASGGIAARMNHRHANVKTPASIQPIGLLADSNGKRINLKDTALPKLVSLFPHPYTVAVVGATINAGQNHYGGNHNSWPDQRRIYSGRRQGDWYWLRQRFLVDDRGWG